MPAVVGGGWVTLGHVTALRILRPATGHTDEVYKFKLWDKTRAVEALAKHFELSTERLE